MALSAQIGYVMPCPHSQLIP